MLHVIRHGRVCSRDICESRRGSGGSRIKSRARQEKLTARSLLPFNALRRALRRVATRDNAPQSVYLPRLLNFGMWRARA